MKVSISWNYKYEQDGYNYKTFDSAEEFVKWFALNRNDVIIWDIVYSLNSHSKDNNNG